MPRIPRTISQRSLPALTSGVTIDPRSIGGNAAAVRKLTSQVQDFAIDFAKKQQRAEQATELNRVNSATARRLSDLELSFEGDTEFETLQERFNTGAQDIRDELRATITDRAVRQTFDKKFEDLRLAKEINIRRTAQRLQVDRGVADLDRSINSFADLAATAKNHVERQLLIDNARVAITNAEAAGFITAENAGVRARRFLSRLDEAQVRALTSTDPGAAVEALAGGKLFRNIDPLRRQTLFDTAIRQADAERKDRVRQADKAERDAEKLQKAIGEELAKEGFTLLADNALTNRWLDINRDKLEKSDFRALQAAVTGAAAPADDPEAVIDLTTRLDQEDIAPAAAQYLRRGELTIGTYQSMVTRNRTLRADDRPASPYRSARERVRVSLDPGQILSGAAAQIARIGQSSAMAELDAFAEANPQATRLEFNREAEAVIDRFQLLNFDQMKIALGLPRFFDGRRDDLSLDDVDAAEREAVRAFDEKRLTPDGLEQELRKLRNWRVILSKKPAAPRTDRATNPARPR